MSQLRTISIAIPTYNRTKVLFDSILGVYDDPRIESITIVDDDSPIEIFEEVRSWAIGLQKIILHRNISNRDCYRNKYTALSLSKSEWNVLLDSDNIISTKYIDAIFARPWDKHTIFTPSFAVPNFNFTAFENLLITKENVAEHIEKPMFETMLNAANYFVHRDEYVKVWDGNVDPVTSDSIYMALRWLEAGNKIFVVPGMDYFHRVWPDSHYQKNNMRTPAGFHQSIIERLKALK